MGCHFPLKGYRTLHRFTDRPGPVVFSEESAVRRDLEVVAPQPVPCGRCQGCLAQKAAEWTTRLVHEGSCWKQNCTLTLTYDPAHAPAFGSLVKSDLSGFIKRLRSYAARSDGVSQDLRFYGVGEYGTNTLRPHYHVVVFNYDLPDLVYWSGKGDRQLATSKVLDGVWSQGQCLVGRFSRESAAYVAGYVMKKMVLDRGAAKYRREGPDGPYQVEPEFALMSRRPGIGGRWVRRFASDVYGAAGGCVIGRGGFRAKAPRTYDQWYAKEQPEAFHAMAAMREADSWERRADNTRERLAVKEECLKARLAQKRRDGV